MPRVASLFLPNLATDRIRRTERRTSPSGLDSSPSRRGGGTRPARHRPSLRPAHGNRRRLPGGARARPSSRHGARPGPRAGSRPRRPRCRARRPMRPCSPGSACSPPAAGLRAPPCPARTGSGSILQGVAHLFGGERAMCARILRFLRAARPRRPDRRRRHARRRSCPRPLRLRDPPDPLPRRRRGRGDRAAAARRSSGRGGGAGRRPPARHRDDRRSCSRCRAAPLERRFGKSLLLRLDQALGRAAEPFDPIVPEEPPSATAAPRRADRHRRGDRRRCSAS